MRRVTRVIGVVLAAFILLTPAMALASDVTNANFLTTLQVTSNSSSTINEAWQTFTLSTNDTISAGMLNATATDLAMRTSGGIDVAFQPSINSTYPWVTEVPTIGAHSQTNLYLYTGNVTGGKVVYFPDTAGANVTDSASIELANNFTMPISVYVDTSTSETIVSKADSWSIYKGSGNVSASIWGVATTDNLTPNAAGDNNTIGGTFADIDDPPGTPDDIATRLSTTSATYLQASFNVTSSVVPATAQINSVQVFFRIGTSGGGADTFAIPYLVLNGIVSNGTAVQNTAGAWSSFTQTITRPGGGSWTIADFPNILVGIFLHSNGVQTGYLTQEYIIINYTPASAFATVGSTGGDILITPHSDATNFWLTAGSAVSANATTATAIDNANPIIFFANNSTPYMNYAQIYVNGVQKGSWIWQYAENFTDLSGNGNTMTPSFRTSGSSPNLAITIQSQAGQQQGDVVSEDSANTAASPIGSAVPGTPENLFHEGGTSFPGGAEIHDLAQADPGIPEMWWMVWFAFGTSLGAAVMVANATSNQKVGRNPSLFLMWITFTIVYIIWMVGGGGVVPGWPLIPDGLIAIVLMIWFNPFKTQLG